MIQTSRRLDSFLYEAAQKFEVFSNIQNWNLKITYRDWCPFQCLSNGITLMQIQSGRTVPLSNRYLYSVGTHFKKSRDFCDILRSHFTLFTTYMDWEVLPCLYLPLFRFQKYIFFSLANTWCEWRLVGAGWADFSPWAEKWCPAGPRKSRLEPAPAAFVVQPQF